MEKIAIITDSCADVPKSFVKEHNIFVLPMVINCAAGEFRDGIDIDAYGIYEKLKTELPKTSTPTGEDILSTFEEIKRQGYTKAMAFILSSGLSGSYNQVSILAEDEDNLEVEVYDSKQASIGTGIIAMLMAEYVESCDDFDKAKEKAAGLIRNTKVFFSLDTLEYLVKGGRIGRATGFAGSLLDLKPILSFDADNGEIYVAAKVRGHKKIEGKLLELVRELANQHKDSSYVIVTADGDFHDERRVIEEKIKQELPDYKASYHTEIGAALSTHLGSGLLGAGIIFVD